MYGRACLQRTDGAWNPVSTIDDYPRWFNVVWLPRENSKIQKKWSKGGQSGKGFKDLKAAISFLEKDLNKDLNKERSRKRLENLFKKFREFCGFSTRKEINSRIKFQRYDKLFKTGHWKQLFAATNSNGENWVYC